MASFIIHLLFLLMAMQIHTCLSTSGNLHPIVLVPGSGGNQLEARLTREHKSSSLLCRLSARQRRGEWFRLWFDPSVLIRPFTRCFAERMTLYYHADIDDYRNAPGVETRVPYFGSTEGLLYLDPHLNDSQYGRSTAFLQVQASCCWRYVFDSVGVTELPMYETRVINDGDWIQPSTVESEPGHITGYMNTVVSALEALGYEDNRTLFGAPYDFRYGLAAAGHPSLTGTNYLSDLTRLIESASAANDNTPVILLSHSLGSLFALHLLLRQPLTWRRRYIHHLITLSAPWAGTVQEMLTFASGYTLGLPLADPLLVRAEQRSSESNLWLLPSPTVFNGSLVEGPKRSYAAADIPEFLEDIGFGEGVAPYKTRVGPLMGRLEEPGVPVTCMVGSGVRTPERLRYGEGGFDEQPEVEYGDGDGTVNMVSLMRLETEWSTEQELKVVEVPGASHTGMLSDAGAMGEIVKEISRINSRALHGRDVHGKPIRESYFDFKP